MPLRLRPADNTFYDLFAEQADHLVTGARLLAEMLGDGNDREATAKKMREAEHDCDDHETRCPCADQPSGAAPASWPERRGRQRLPCSRGIWSRTG